MSDGSGQQATPRGGSQALPLYQPYRLASSQQQQQQPFFDQRRPVVHPFPSTEVVDGFPPVPSGSGSRSNSNESEAQTQPTSNHSDSSGSRRAPHAVPGPIPGNSYSNRSCGPCRERRVRCDRLHPICDRCKKRGEECTYPALANVEVKTETPTDPRVLELEAKLASVQEQLRTTTQASSSHPAPHPPPPIALAAHPAVSPTTTSFPASFSLAEKIHGSVVPNLSLGEAEVVKNFLLGEQAQNYQIGQQALDWRLMQPSMAEALTQSLLDASARACCSRLPALKFLVDRVPMYKARLHALDPAGQLAVAVLTSLGARAAPHSAILGVPTEALSDGRATPALYLTAGERREKACRSLEARANELAWGGRVLQEDRWENLQSLAGLTQLLIFEEQRAKQSRTFLRNAVGMYIDLVLQKGAEDDPGFDIRKSVGTSLFADDTTIAPRFNKPCIIAASELDDFFEPNGVQMPDFINTRLGPIIDNLLRSAPATKDQLQEALTTTALWVCGCQRIFSRLSTAPKPGQPSILPEIHSLYTLIDEVHSSIQRLQQFLVSISHIPPGCEGDLFALDHFVLLGVRADTYLIDLVNMIHTWLLKDRSNLSGMEDWAEAENDERLHKLRWESTLRVRKSLKLVAFYSQLYLASSDKHVVHHLTIQLELLPNWTILACQRVGDPGGPLTSEFELTEEELDWMRQALELACYFTPVAGRRLQELCSERAKHTASQAPQPDPLTHHSPPDPRPSNDNPFGDSAAAETSPFLFDQYGVVSDAGGGEQQPLLRGFGAVDALGRVGGEFGEAEGRQHDAMAGFEGSSWMDVTLGDLWSEGEGATSQDMWMG